MNELSQKYPLPDVVTAEAVRRLVTELRVRTWQVRECSICGVGVGYAFYAAGGVYFDGRCGCGCGGEQQPRDFDDVADLIQRQPAASARAVLWESLRDSSFKGQPLVRMFCVDAGREARAGSYDVLGLAVDEEGAVLARHVSSSCGWSKHDLAGHDKAYAARYPQGYELLWVDDPTTDPVARAHVPAPAVAHPSAQSDETLTLDAGNGELLIGLGEDAVGTPLLAFKRVRHGRPIGSLTIDPDVLGTMQSAPDVVLRVHDATSARGLVELAKRLLAKFEGSAA